MSSRITGVLCLAMLGLALLTMPARAEEAAPQAVIQGFYDTLLGVMEQGQSLQFAGRYARLEPAIEKAFDLPLMSRLSVGPQWQSMTADQQRELTAAFSQYTISTYANRFDDYSGERFEVLPQTSQAGSGTIVQTRLIKSDGDPVALNYLMRQDGGRWQIVDVFLSGTISELAARRAEFTSVLRRDGPQGLLQLLARRISDLKTS